MNPHATHERTRSRFRAVHAFIVFSSWATVAAADPAAHAHEASADCALEQVHDHVREQFAQFGPLSAHREYFGFVYRSEGKIASAVVRSRECRESDQCTMNTAVAARAIPKGARVLGEWHTHPLTVGSRSLSTHDVRGARNNRHISCYRAFYSTPEGEIYSWDAGQTSVPTAMATRMRLGNLFDSSLPDHGMHVARIKAHNPELAGDR